MIINEAGEVVIPIDELDQHLGKWVSHAGHPSAPPERYVGSLEIHPWLGVVGVTSGRGWMMPCETSEVILLYPELTHVE